jgi:transcriptional regulator with XRE-family HTH domain
MDAGWLLQAVRRRHGLTQAELGQRAGTSQPVISAYEHGHRDPTLTTLRKLIAAGGEQLIIDAQIDSSARCGDVDEHARRLVDVLTLVDAIPVRPRNPTLIAPRIVSSPRC